MAREAFDRLPRSDRVVLPAEQPSLAPGDPGTPQAQGGWDTARIVSVIVPIVLTIGVLAFFVYLWLARRSLVKGERRALERRWANSGGTIIRKGREVHMNEVSGHRPNDKTDFDYLPGVDEEELYAPGYHPRYSVASTSTLLKTSYPSPELSPNASTTNLSYSPPNRTPSREDRPFGTSPVGLGYVSEDQGTREESIDEISPAESGESSIPIRPVPRSYHRHLRG